MQRGSHIFSTLFADPTPAIANADKVKGRDAALIDKRNERLLYRYFYYGYYTDKRVTAIYAILSEEFDLTERRIHDIISDGDNYTVLSAIRKAPPSVRELRSKYPFLVWD